MSNVNSAALRGLLQIFSSPQNTQVDADTLVLEEIAAFAGKNLVDNAEVTAFVVASGRMPHFDTGKAISKLGISRHGDVMGNVADFPRERRDFTTFLNALNIRGDGREELQDARCLAVLSIGDDQEMLGSRHSAPPIVCVVGQEEFIHTRIDDKFWHSQSLSVHERVDDVHQDLGSRVIDLRGEVELGVVVEGERPATVRAVVVLDVLDEVEFVHHNRHHGDDAWIHGGSGPSGPSALGSASLKAKTKLRIQRRPFAADAKVPTESMRLHSPQRTK